ncbi:MAG: hypothetical protein LBE97_00195 [Holosporales bacterium]|jgi:hypothetical protein|nr:hypothetical protein [Holosporales bacterium]
MLSLKTPGEPDLLEKQNPELSAAAKKYARSAHNFFSYLYEGSDMVFRRPFGTAGLLYRENELDAI